VCVCVCVCVYICMYVCMYVCMNVATHESLSVALTATHLVSACVHSTETDMSRENTEKCSVLTCMFGYGALKMN